MKGICNSVGSSLGLEEGKVYYLFPHGNNNYYVSKFDRVTAHTGSFRRELFDLIEEGKPIEQSEAKEQPEVQTEKFNNYTQMDLFEFIDEEADNPRGIEIVIPEDVLAPFENPAGLATQKFRKGQLRWKAYVKAVEEYQGCSFFAARELVFKHRGSNESIEVAYDPEIEAESLIREDKKARISPDSDKVIIS